MENGKGVLGRMGLDDLFVIAGLGALCYGFYQYDPRLAYVVGGGVAIAIGLMASLVRYLRSPRRGRE